MRLAAAAAPLLAMLISAQPVTAQSVRKGPIPDKVTIRVEHDAETAIRGVDDGKTSIAQVGEWGADAWKRLSAVLTARIERYSDLTDPATDVPAFIVNKDTIGARMAAGYRAALDRWSLITADVKPNPQAGDESIKALSVSLYDDDLAVALAVAACGDPAYLRAPLTGAYTPLRARWSGVTTDVQPGKNADGDVIQIGKIPVPEDAIVWDAVEKSWRKVGPGVTSFSSATYTYVWGAWHTGQPITIADIMYAVAFRQEEASRGPASEPIPYRGFTTNKDGTITAYFDYRGQDPNQTGAMGAPYLSLNQVLGGAAVPWEILEALKLIGSEDGGTWASSTAREVILLDPARAEDIRAKLEEMEASRYVPASISPWMTAAAAAARCRTAMDWIGEHGNALISNGPFMVAKADVAAGSIEAAAFRAAGYPFETTYWRRLLSGRTARIDDVAVPSPAPRTKDARILVNVAAVSYPTGTVSVPDASLKVRLTVTDLKKTYSAVRDKTGQYAATIPAADLKKLPVGSCTVSVEAFFTTEPPAVKAMEIVLQ